MTSSATVQTARMAVKAKQRTLFPGNDGGFTLMELLVVVLIIAVMGAITYPAVRRGMDSMKYQKDRQSVILFFKRALVHARMDGKARTIELDGETGALVCGKRKLLPFAGEPVVETLLLNGDPAESVAISPHRLVTVGVRFPEMEINIDLYDGKVTETHEP